MLLHSTTLLVAASASLAIASATAATIGVRQRQRRGVWWWIAANLGFAGALATHALEDQSDLLAPIAAVLGLQWPIVTLVGMRRYFARGGSSVPAWADFVVLGTSLLLVLGAWYLPWSGVVQDRLLVGAMLFSTVYAALALWRLEDFATTPILHGLLIALVGSASLQAAWWAIASFLLVPVPTGADLTVGAWLAPAVVALLIPQLTLVMTHERNVAQLRASHRKLRHMVEVDPLTRLPNRRHFHELAAKAIQPQQELTTVLVFDVDRLKHINEVLGHQIGDEALKQIGTVLRETLRRRDVAGRLGGDEFAAVLPRPASPMSRPSSRASTPGSTTARWRRGSPASASTSAPPRCSPAKPWPTPCGGPRSSSRPTATSGARPKRWPSGWRTPCRPRR